jgi:nucleolar protein 4
MHSTHLPQPPFTTKQDLRAVFQLYGPIHPIHFRPKKTPAAGDDEEAEDVSSSSSKKKNAPRAKGFAFVWMLSRKDAECAIEGCNGKTVRVRTAEVLISNKQKREK